VSLGGIVLLGGAVVVGYVVYEAWQGQKSAGCPDGGKLADLVTRVADGSIDGVTAESMARGFDNAGCTAAASAVRVAAHAAVAKKSGIVKLPSGATPTGIGGASGGMSTHTLTDADVAMGPAAFALSVGYVTPPASCALSSYGPCTVVDAMLADNPTMTKAVAGPMPGQPEVYPVLGKAPGSVLGYFAVNPWKVGQTLNVPSAAMSPEMSHAATGAIALPHRTMLHPETAAKRGAPASSVTLEDRFSSCLLGRDWRTSGGGVTALQRRAISAVESGPNAVEYLLHSLVLPPTELPSPELTKTIRCLEAYLSDVAGELAYRNRSVVTQGRVPLHPEAA
jgi:hypothetical protein